MTIMAYANENVRCRTQHGLQVSRLFRIPKNKDFNDDDQAQLVELFVRIYALDAFLGSIFPQDIYVRARVCCIS